MIPEKKAGFYGWKVVAVLLLTWIYNYGLLFFCFGHFVQPVMEEMQISGSIMGLAIPLTFVGAAITGFFIGPLIDKYSIKNMLVTGTIIHSLAYVILAFSKSIFLMGFILIAVISTGFIILYLGASKLVFVWFSKHAGKAMGIVGSGPALGGFIVPPLLAYTISSFGWRNSLLFYGLFGFVVITLLQLVFVKNSPESIGQFPDGGSEKITASSKAAVPVEILTITQILGNINFWGIGFIVGLALASHMTFNMYFVPFMNEINFQTHNAAALISLYAISSLVAVNVYGYLLDKVKNIRFLYLSFPIGVTAAWLLILTNNILLISAGALILGLMFGGIVPCLNSGCAKIFGINSLGKVLAIINLLYTAIYIQLPFWGGIIYDKAGNYSNIFKTAIFIYPIMFIFILLIKQNKKPIAETKQ